MVQRASRLRLLGAVASTLLLLGTSSAAAAERLRSTGESEEWGGWSAPAECIEEAELLQKVESSFASDGPATKRRVEGSMWRTAEGWAVRLEVWEDGQGLGERRLELVGESCRLHDETVALVFSLLLEDGPPPVDAPLPSTDSASLAVDGGGSADRDADLNRDADSEQTPHSTRGKRFWAGAGPVVDGGLTAGLGAGTQINAGWRVRGALTLRIDGAALFGVEQRRDWGSYATRTLHAGFSPCYESVGGSWGVLSCVGAEALGFSARARGVLEARRVTRWAPALVARLELRRLLGRHVFLSLSGSLALSSRSFRIVLSTPEGRQQVAESEPLFGTLGAAMGLSF